MDNHSYNLLEPYLSDGGNAYHYNALQCDVSAPGSYFRVNFTRDVTSSGVALNITSITNLNNVTPSTAAETAFLTNEVNSFVGLPLNGDECQTIGWQYLGHTSTNNAYIEDVKSSAGAQGYTFKSLFYNNGYFVYGCSDTKQFYDQNT
jgi:hypothetical protein